MVLSSIKPTFFSISYAIDMKVEEALSSNISACFYQTTRPHRAEGIINCKQMGRH